MSKHLNRRGFLKNAGALPAGAVLTAGTGARAAHHEMKKYKFSISLAGWSLHRSLGEGEGKKPMLDMPKISKQEFGIGAIELVNQMMASDSPEYVKKLGANAEKEGVKILLIMIDRQGDVGAEDADARADAVKNHKHWIEIAQTLGCNSVRMNWGGAPKDFLENREALRAFVRRSVPGCRELCEFGETKDIDISIENHGGPSSYPQYLTRLIERIDHPRMGTLPDFGNFPEDVDRYGAIDSMMPYAKAVSAKCYDFDEETGLETKIDYPRMMEIVCGKHGYSGHIGIEYEGKRLDEYAGIHAAKKLLDKLRA